MNGTATGKSIVNMYCSMPKGTSQAETTFKSKNVKPIQSHLKTTVQLEHLDLYLLALSTVSIVT